MSLPFPQQESGFDLELYLGIHALEDIVRAAWRAADSDRLTLTKIKEREGAQDPLNRMLIHEPQVTGLEVESSTIAKLSISVIYEFRNFDPPPQTIESLIRLTAATKVIQQPVSLPLQGVSNPLKKPGVQTLVPPPMPPPTILGSSSPTVYPPRSVSHKIDFTISAELILNHLELGLKSDDVLSIESRQWLRSEGNKLTQCAVDNFVLLSIGVAFFQKIPLDHFLQQAIFLPGSATTHPCLAIGVMFDAFLLRGYPLKPEYVPENTVEYEAWAVPVPQIDPVTKKANYNKDAPWGPSVSFGVKILGKVLPIYALRALYAKLPLSRFYPLDAYDLETDEIGNFQLINKTTRLPVSGYDIERVAQHCRERGKKSRLVNQFAKRPLLLGRIAIVARLSPETLNRVKHHMMNFFIPNTPPMNALASVGRPMRPLPLGSAPVEGQYTDVELKYMDYGIWGQIHGSLRYGAVNGTMRVPFEVRQPLYSAEPPQVKLTIIDTEIDYLPDQLVENIAENIFGYNLNVMKSEALTKGQNKINEVIGGLGLPKGLPIRESRHENGMLRRSHEVMISVRRIEVDQGNLMMSLFTAPGSRAVQDSQSSFAGISRTRQVDTNSTDGLYGLIDSIVIQWANKDGKISSIGASAFELLCQQGLVPLTTVVATNITWEGGLATSVTVQTPKGGLCTLSVEEAAFLVNHLRVLAIRQVTIVPGHAFRIDADLANKMRPLAQLRNQGT